MTTIYILISKLNVILYYTVEPPADTGHPTIGQINDTQRYMPLIHNTVILKSEINLFHFYLVSPVVEMTSLHLEQTRVTLNWLLSAGTVAVLELRYKSFTEDPTITSSDVAITDTDVSDWTVLRIISPEETRVVANHEFNRELYNSFALLPFEDEELQQKGITTYFCFTH